MISHTPLDIHPLNAIFFVMMFLILVISFTCMVIHESDDEKDNDDIEPETIEEIYETAEKIREEPDCFGPEASASLAKFNSSLEWGGEPSEKDNEDEYDIKQVEEYLPDVLLLVKMPYVQACNMLQQYNSNDVQFYGFHKNKTSRTRSQSI